MVDIRNNGKQLALYDKAQQDRNKLVKYKLANKREVMFIYMLVSFEKTQQPGFEPTFYKLDMRLLLRDNQVLSFSFDDIGESFSQICVQARDLYLYLIDFTNHTVVQKVMDRHSTVRKSIFYNYPKREGTLQFFQHVKSFIRDQELNGNLVLLPKLNEDFLVVLEKDSCLAKFYSIPLQRFVR